MNIQINEKWYDASDLTFIAKFQNMEDQNNYYHFREMLFRANDGTYIVKCQGNPGSKYHKMVSGVPVRSQKFSYEPHPELWLLNHGHERLAGFMFPQIRSQVELALNSFGYKCDLPTGEVFYSTGEVKGEVNHVE